MFKNNYYLKFCILFFVVLFAAGFIKSFIFDVKLVKGKSMEPVLKDGDFIFIFKAAYGIKLPWGNSYLLRWAEPAINDLILYVKDGHFTVKRCAGTAYLPIEFYKGLGYNNELFYTVTTGGKTIELTAVQFRNLGGMADKQKQVIPKGYILALGDNLEASYDSRDYGFIFIGSIYGKVLLWK
ncbi:signal peptidase I [Treponema pedis]|uniref:signal peptidase I n=1 Tax=Treponema pedis TaxID=409322 RepID=UPI0004235A3A|nr:signal peptidase I [Treponema pedis]